MSPNAGEDAFILAYITDDGQVATMPVSDRDQFQPGVTTTATWATLDANGRAALAAASIGPVQIARREQARKGPSREFRAAHKGLSDWASGPRIMFEGTGLGVIAWERGAPGEWTPAKGPIEVQTPDGPRYVYGSGGSLLLPKRPAHTLRRGWADAKADSDAIISAAPVITADILEDLDRRAEAGEDVVLILADGELRVEASAGAAGLHVVCRGMAQAVRLARHADVDGEPYGHQPTYESEAWEWQQELLGSL